MNLVLHNGLSECPSDNNVIRTMNPMIYFIDCIDIDIQIYLYIFCGCGY